MSVSERRKGMAFEAQVARAFRDAGHRVERLQQQQGEACDFVVNDTLYVDTKRQERMRVPEWLAQARAQAPRGTVPVVVFRQSRGEAFAVLPLAHLLEIAR